MMKWILGLLVVVLAAAVVVLVVAQDPGYAILGYGGWSVETTLALLVGAVLVGYVALWLGWRVLRLAWRLPRLVRDQRERALVDKARGELMKGLMELAEGRWPEAERLLSRHVDDAEMPVLHCLAAARAAQRQDAFDRRDKYLRRAFEAMPDAEVAIGLTQAELQMSAGQTEQALASLRRLHRLAPRHGHVARLLARLYRRVGDWESLLRILPEVRRGRVAAAEELGEMELEAIRGRLGELCEQGDLEALKGLWKGLSKAQRHDAGTALAYAEALRALHADRDAEVVLRQQLERQWSEALIHAYSRLDLPDAQGALQQAENWSRAHPNSPGLLLAVARLAAAKELWGKARGNLERLLEVSPSAEAHLELGHLLESLGDADEAHDHYRRGLERALGQGEGRPPAVVAPAAEG